MLAHWQPSSAQDRETANANNDFSPVQISPPVDMEQLLDAANGDDDLLRELITLYLEQMSGGLEKLKLAAKPNSAEEIKSIAHNLVGGSATCGMLAVVPLLRQLENTDYGDSSNKPLPVITQVEEQFERVKKFPQEFLQENKS